jgi:hypothetical protein
MKHQNLIVLGLAALALWMVTRASKATAAPAPGNRVIPAPNPSRNPYLDAWPTGPNGEGLF